ncbi:MAG: DUF1844 domain-containing protein [Thermoleophilia bacterium]
MSEEEKKETGPEETGAEESAEPGQEETAAQETTPAGQEETAAPAGEKEPAEMTEEELRAEFEKQFRMQKVDDVLVQFMISLTNLAYMKMGLTEDTADVKDLAQASLAIDGYKALLEAVGKRLPEQDAQALTGALSSMQMTFVKASSPA